MHGGSRESKLVVDAQSGFSCQCGFTAWLYMESYDVVAPFVLAELDRAHIRHFCQQATHDIEQHTGVRIPQMNRQSPLILRVNQNTFIRVPSLFT